MDKSNWNRWKNVSRWRLQFANSYPTCFHKFQNISYKKCLYQFKEQIEDKTSYDDFGSWLLDS